MMAKIAEQFADQVIVTDDNPRTENAEQIFDDIKAGFLHPERISMIHDRAKAIREAVTAAKAGDCILIAGKGAETYQIIGKEKFPFLDVEQVAIALN
jgi:UDP-N-acetylmuramoyl-L-alanyl-D-glutamate--2,6-diaminopimelate ligase